MIDTIRENIIDITRKHDGVADFRDISVNKGVLIITASASMDKEKLTAFLADILNTKFDLVGIHMDIGDISDIPVQHFSLHFKV